MATKLIRPRCGFVSAVVLTSLALPALPAVILSSERGQSVALHVRITREAIQELNQAHTEQRRQIDAEFDKAMAEADALLEARLRELRASDGEFKRALENVSPKVGQKQAGPTTREQAHPERPAQKQPEPGQRNR
jgi:hypothetical protein